MKPGLAYIKHMQIPLGKKIEMRIDGKPLIVNRTWTYGSLPNPDLRPLYEKK